MNAFHHSYVLFVLSIVCCSLLFLTPAVCADKLEASQYQQLHQQYVELSRSDPNVVERSRWDELIGDTNAFIARGLSAEFAPKSLFLLARIQEHIFRRHREPATLAAALERCQTLIEQYPDSALADDALLTLGDLERDGRNDDVAAVAAYRRIVSEYPHSDSYEKAKRRIVNKQTSAAKATRGERKSKGFLSTFFSSKDDLKVDSERVEDEVLNQRDAFAEHPLVSQLPRIPTIAIDPGHGGEEDGAHGVGGVVEKEVVLQISIMLEEMLRKRLKARTVLTRVRDVTVDLNERTKIANQHEADLFISIHANASPSKRLSGIETYYLDNTNDKSSLRLAERENAGSQQEMSDLGFIISDLIQNAKLDDSVSLAHYIQNALVGRLSQPYPDVRDLGVKKAPFFVLVGAHMPCVLVEVSFIDHKVEGLRLQQRSYQKLVAEALFDGIVRYLEHRWIDQETNGQQHTFAY